MSKFLSCLLIITGIAHYSSGQKKENVPPCTLAEERAKGVEQRAQLEKKSLLTNVRFRSVGPSVMSGRVADLDVSPDDPTRFYVAYASGGCWRTDNNGISFEPVFDNEAVMTIGDIAVDWNHNERIWIGTGEANSSRSSYSGNGIYRSDDRGKTWNHCGLDETHHIGRILIHPQDPNTLWVAALGHLYSANAERGVFKTVDGGKTWKQTLYVDENTGVSDLVIDPLNPDVLYAAAWHRERRAWNFEEAGKTSGIYKSVDGGNTWKLISSAESGFPQGNGIGRIGLAVYSGNSNIVYAVLDNQTKREKEKKAEDKFSLTKDTLRKMPKEEFLKLDDELIEEYLTENGFPEKYDAKSVKKMVKNDKIVPLALVDFLEDANAALYNAPIVGTQVFRSDDGGASWKKQNDSIINQLSYTYGYYFGQIRVSPYDDKKIFIMGLEMLKSTDAGKTFKALDKGNTHGDHHALWEDPKRKGHLIIGNDGGVNISYDDGKTWFKANTPAAGQFYSVNVDMAKPYNVYGGLQDNGVWCGSSANSENYDWYQDGQYPFKMILGGDGMQVQVDTRDNTTVYTGFQFGYYYRVNRKNGNQKLIQPKPELGEKALRFNWQTPILLSRHNQDVLYLGSNRFHRSMDKGNDFKTLSDDLTRGGKKGDVAYGTITAIDESPMRFGLIYAGTDDGLIHVSKDDGNTWDKISDALPQNFWISRLAASAFSEGRVYASLNGYRWDNFSSMVYRSDDYGAHWQKIGNDLPAEPVNVVREDPVNENIIYVGTDHGIYVSLNSGKSFMCMQADLPRAPVHDLVIHPRDHDLVAGTHGRSIYIASVKELQQLVDTVLEKEAFAFETEPVRFSKSWGKRSAAWRDVFESSAVIPYYVKQNGMTSIKIKSTRGLVLADLRDTSEAGLNYFKYDLSFNGKSAEQLESEINSGKKNEKEKISIKASENKKYYLPPAEYSIEITTSNGSSVKTELVVKAPEKKKREEEESLNEPGEMK